LTIHRGQLTPELRDALEAQGVDSVRALLVTERARGLLANIDYPLGNGMEAPRGAIEYWLKLKAAREAVWVRVGVAAAIVAAVFSVAGLIVEFNK
jgi:hypothetical protein